MNLFTLGIEVIGKLSWKIFSFLLDSFLGLIQILFYMQYQRIFILFMIICGVAYDIYFIAPGCTKFQESCVHILVIISPFIYLSRIANKEVVK